MIFKLKAIFFSIQDGEEMFMVLH